MANAHARHWMYVQVICTMRVDIRLSRLLYLYKERLPAVDVAAHSSDRVQVVEEHELDVILQVLKIPQVQTAEWLHGVLLDCTRYEHRVLADAAMGVLIRLFEQKATLSTVANSVQLLSKRRMVSFYTLFEELLRRLTTFTARRRLLDERDEPYKTANLLGQLTRVRDPSLERTPCPD